MTWTGLRSLLLVATLAACLAPRARASLVPVDDFSDLVLWAGSGTNSAGFVLQFAATESPTAIAWGYRWNGAATMQAMMDAIAGTTTLVNGAPVPPGLDARLSISGTQYSFGVFLSTIAYDQIGLPAGWSQVTRQIENDFVQTGTYPTLYTRADAGGAWLGEGQSQVMTFTYSQVGASDITLASGGWYGFVQSSGPETFAFAQPMAAVPEPGTWGLAAGAAAATAAARAWRRRR
ncbi:MAG: PEP-CTERM sorting domain-containing protein [Planctomycetota bacterium]